METVLSAVNYGHKLYKRGPFSLSLPLSLVTKCLKQSGRDYSQLFESFDRAELAFSNDCQVEFEAQPFFIPLCSLNRVQRGKIILYWKKERYSPDQIKAGHR